MVRGVGLDVHVGSDLSGQQGPGVPTPSFYVLSVRTVQSVLPGVRRRAPSDGVSKELTIRPSPLRHGLVWVVQCWCAVSVELVLLGCFDINIGRSLGIDPLRRTEARRSRFQASQGLLGCSQGLFSMFLCKDRARAKTRSEADFGTMFGPPGLFGDDLGMSPALFHSGGFKFSNFSKTWKMVDTPNLEKLVSSTPRLSRS